MLWRWSAVGILVMAFSWDALGAAVSQSAQPKSYKKCMLLNKDYPHGVGRTNAKDKTSGKPVTNFKVSNTLYAYNDGGSPRKPGERDLDRDNDGIACEKH